MKKQIWTLLAALLLLAGCAERNLNAASSPKSSAPAESAAPAQSQASDGPQVQTAPAESERRTGEFAALLASGRYYIDCTALISVEGMRMENDMLIAVEDGNSSISLTSTAGGSSIKMRTLTLNGKSYSVNDAERVYTALPDGQTSGFNIDFSGLQYLDETMRDFDGQQRYCERYGQGEDIVCLFWENGALTGLTRTIADEQLAELTLRIRGISGNIPAGLVSMPIGYQQQ